jgi:hypothetical protein
MARGSVLFPTCTSCGGEVLGAALSSRDEGLLRECDLWCDGSLEEWRDKAPRRTTRWIAASRGIPPLLGGTTVAGERASTNLVLGEEQCVGHALELSPCSRAGGVGRRLELTSAVFDGGGDAAVGDDPTLLQSMSVSSSQVRARDDEGSSS